MLMKLLFAYNWKPEMDGSEISCSNIRDRFPTGFDDVQNLGLKDVVECTFA